MAIPTPPPSEAARLAKMTPIQAVSYAREHYPLIFWGEIGVVVLILALLALAIAGFFAVRLRAWGLTRMVAYVKKRFPDSWHLSSTLWWLWFLGLVFIAGTFVVWIANIHSMAKALSSPGYELIFWLLLLMVVLMVAAADFTITLQRRLLADAPHTFSPRHDQLHLLATTVSSIEGMPARIQGMIDQRLGPRLRSWPCRFCGERRSSPRHAVGWSVYDANDATDSKRQAP